ncbi:MAG TPA: DUF3618 domain-containing protein [Actinomycetes bacterium]|nr:DUF3618 domain-containing protein [Actinomycetes bacterium]
MASATNPTVADLETARQNLAATIDAITERVNPLNVTRRKLRDVRRMFVSDEGSPNVRNIAIAGTVTTILVLYVIRRRGA